MNDDINYNNNLLKLPFILFKKILSYLDDNIDKIVFSLVSKKLYDNRNSFLYIPLNITDKTTRCMIKNLKLRSFVNQIESYDHQDDSFHKIKTIIAVHQETFFGFPKVFSSYILKDKLEKLKESDISDDIEELFFTCNFYSLLRIPAIKRIKSLSVSLTAPINYAIPNNITSLCLVFYDSPESFGENAALPSQLESLTLFSHRMHRFEKGFFPLTLKKLRLVDSAPKFEYGVLPQGLKSLMIEYTSYDQPIAKGVLPSSLKSIGLGSYSRKLVFYNPTDINDDRTSTDLEYTYIPNTIRMLMIGSPQDRDKKTLDLELPSSLKKFELGKSFNQKLGKFVVPNTLTRLRLIRSDQLERIPATIDFLCLKYINLEIASMENIGDGSFIKIGLGFINNILGGQTKVGFNWIGPSINTLMIPLESNLKKDIVILEMNDDINNNNNLLKLPFILFKKILSYLDDNIDKITTRCMIKNLKLRSFVNQIESYDHQDDAYHKIKTIISVSQHDFVIVPKVFSSYIGNDKLEQLMESDISDDIEEIIVENQFSSILKIPAINRIKSLSVSLSDAINYAIPNNITSLSLYFYNSDESFGENTALPSQLESLTIFSRRIPRFKKGFFPLTLKKLRLASSAPKFDIGVLPEGLESLKIEYKTYNQPIARGVLPSSLKSIGLESYSGRLVFYNPTEINDDRTSTDLEDTYISNTIRRLMIGTTISYYKTLDLELPCSLKKFELGTFNQKLGKFVVPNTLTQLKLIRSDQLERIPATINFLCLKYIYLEITSMEIKSQKSGLANLAIGFINNILGQDKAGFKWIGPAIKTLKIPFAGMTKG
ncbi:hypothetical protein PPL_05038 [Heterostelium album PN500]|uniref:F-box domain-containing protein n=1 Tax=Heterostelium pallidum (strain ATCC 26659 / Pp 5 / PN500) TaxID=670386 RepID=D3B994_HETP5|nr:hypothetical protein PPL_05038 [Heterostelium album PN500]EFA82133.1 hypothetical protein PPL_05038 [Heterostelium album PN500]|eukprot:XP_020434250.1 hypothetical protein PPL_05038 [Heterostelium album PN500]